MLGEVLEVLGQVSGLGQAPVPVEVVVAVLLLEERGEETGIVHYGEFVASESVAGVHYYPEFFGNVFESDLVTGALERGCVPVDFEGKVAPTS